MSVHHRPQQPQAPRAPRPSPGIPMQTRSSHRSTLSPDTRRSTPDYPRRAPRTRTRQSLIDLTDSSPLRPAVSPPPGEHTHHPKRRRTSPPAPIEEVDLTDLGDNEEEAARRKAREELLKTQQAARKDEKRKVAGFTCVICMEDEPTDLAVTPCGHMFCHLCLHGAIKASASPSNKVHGRCPVCRGKVSLKDVIPMEFKILTKSQGKQKAV